MWENRFNERIDSPLFLDHWKRLKKFQIFVTMGQLSILGKNVGINGDAIDCDIWVDAAGADSVMSAYEKFGKYNSRMVFVAVGTNKRGIDVLGLTFGQKSITGSGGYSHEDVMDVMKIMKSKKWDIEKLITHEYHLEELSKADNLKLIWFKVICFFHIIFTHGYHSHRMATIFIAVTDDDCTNICAAQIAKKVFHIEKVVARIYDEEKYLL